MSAKPEIKIWKGPLADVELPPGNPVPKEVAEADALRVAKAVGPYLKRLDEWRRRSLERARTRFVGKAA